MYERKSTIFPVMTRKRKTVKESEKPRVAVKRGRVEKKSWSRKRRRMLR